jgi:hypothetical protein
MRKEFSMGVISGFALGLIIILVITKLVWNPFSPPHYILTEECRSSFVQWCAGCVIGNWTAGSSSALSSEINICMKEYHKIDLSNITYCDSAKEGCRAVGVY